VSHFEHPDELTLDELVQLAIALEVPAADLVAAAIAAADSADDGPGQRR
jgi:hypothetical protein